jgi:acetyl esterase/lipase
MHKLLGQKKLVVAAVVFTFLWTSAGAADPAQGAEGQQTTKDVKQVTNKFDFGKRIVYSINGMANVVTAHDVVYKSEGDTKLLMNVYSPPKLTSDARLPVVLFVHGGPISPDTMPPKEWGIYQSYGELIAASGFVGVTFNHRLFSQNDYGRSQSDVAAAIEYVRSHANELHVDANRMALWVYSAGGPHLSWILRERPAGLRCAVAFYSRLDLRPYLPPNADAKVVAAVERLSAAAQVKEYGANLPMFIARAGLDAPQLNQGIDRFVMEALAANLQIEVMNHNRGQHSFDVLDDDDRSREIIARAVAFLQAHLQLK